MSTYTKIYIFFIYFIYLFILPNIIRLKMKGCRLSGVFERIWMCMYIQLLSYLLTPFVATEIGGI